jgi:hypothetical protein
MQNELTGSSATADQQCFDDAGSIFHFSGNKFLFDAANMRQSFVCLSAAAADALAAVT